MHTIDHALRKVERGFAITAGLIAMLSMLMTTLDIMLRNLFNISLVSVYELVTHSFVIVVALGLSYVQASKQNVVVDIATNALPHFYKRVLDILGCLIGLFIIGIIAWQNMLSTISSFIGGDYSIGLIAIPLWPTKLALTCGLMLLTVRLLYDLIFLVVTINKREHTDSKVFEENQSTKMSI